MRRILRNQRGDTMVTVLLGAVLVAVAALATTAGVKFMGSEARFARAVGTAISIEKFLLSALQQPATYAGAASAKLANGERPTGLTFEMQGVGGNVPVAKVGARMKLTEEGKSCTVEPCALYTDIDIACTGTLCRAAYRVEINVESAKLSLPPLGAVAWPPTAADYTQLLHFELFRRQGKKLVCDGNELFLAGMNRSEGTVSCVGPMTRRLAANEIAKSMRYSASTNSLEYASISLKRGVCPERYVAQAFEPASLETNPSGTCVYRYKKEVPWLKPWPAARESVDDRFCPSDYRHVASAHCVGTVVSRTNGYCPKTCTDADGNPYDCGRVTVPDTSFTIEQSVTDSAVSCRMVKTGTQECGASWEGAVHWSGACQLKVPEIVSMGGE